MPGTDATLDLEWSLILAACSLECSEAKSPEKIDWLRSLLREPIRWNIMFQLADRHGVEPTLYQALLGFSDLIPADAMQALRRTYQTNLHKTLLLSRELIRIVDCLSDIGADVLAYKGLALAEVHYGDIALRQSGDIDLLIRAHDLRRIREAVGELGYTPHEVFEETLEREYLKSGYECAFDGKAGPNLLELQWAIQPRFYAIDFNMEEMFARAVTVSVAGRPMRTPSPEDLLLVLSAHAAKHVWGRLVWLCDIAHLVKLPSLNWDWIWAEAGRLGMLRILQVTLLAANRLLGARIPASHFADDAALRLAEEIQAQITCETAYNVESLSYFRLMMRLRERRMDRLRFLSRLILTPGPGEWKAVRLPRPLFPLYRLVRLSRLAARLVRA
jgi:hypothetical protein